MKTSNREEKRKKKKGKRSFVAFLIFAFALYVAINVALSYGGRIETMLVRTGTEEEVIAAEGYIFKDQTVITAPTSGYVYCEAEEEQRVKIGETVIHIHKNQVDASASSELKMVEEKINELSAGKIKGDVFSNDSAKIEQEILLSLKDVPYLGYKNNIKAVSEIKDNVNSLIEDRRIIKGEAQPKDSSKELEELMAKKAELEKQYNIERTAVYAPTAGAFTSRVDGMEELLSTKKLGEVSVDYIKELDKKFEKPSVLTKAKENDAVGKIVNNFNWSVAAVVPIERIEDVDVGDNIEIRLSDIGTETVMGTVSKIQPDEKGKAVLVVKSNRYINNIYSISRANVEFVKHHYEGFKIPSESIRIIDGKTGVYIIKSDKAKFVPVDILYNSKKWVVVAETLSTGDTTLKLYDELIVSGKELYDNKVVR
ncbi:MAG: hypothetical protein IJW15_03495 [Clostridia bacterium]|nr:hypothetical protein [Clostridia bacterium]